MQCPHCSRENRDDAKFCDGCGSALDITLVHEAADPLLATIRAAFAERYVVESILGRGGMGCVFKARERSLDRYVALKVIDEDNNRDPQFVERFRREAKLAARLRHPRIVSIHEVGILGGFHYFSMDCIEGSTLRHVVQRKQKLSAEDATAIVSEICRGIAHAHQKGVIHRDLKPENVMIDAEGDVFVMDFGLARAPADQKITQTGVLVGSPFYMSPEQFSGEEADERSDVFSLGLMLYYCLTGDDLFAAETITGVAAKHATMRIAAHMSTQHAIPPQLRTLLVSMLEPNRDARARSAREVLERLTLRRIVALGMDATETLPVTLDLTMPAQSPPPAVEEAPVAAAAARRKARLRSLLDDM